MSGARLAVKICGVRRQEDARAAAAAGANYVGMVFVPGRRRRVEPANARLIVEELRGAYPEPPATVGLFGDQGLGEVLATIDVSGIDYVQLCGDESVEYCRAALDKAGVIKVLHVPSDADADAMGVVEARMADFAGVGCKVTLDSEVAGLHGGTGTAFDWRVAARLSERREFMLAGGLTPENVAGAVTAVRPWGVDVSSGVETDGEKDAAKIRSFVANARKAG